MSLIPCVDSKREFGNTRFLLVGSFFHFDAERRIFDWLPVQSNVDVVVSSLCWFIVNSKAVVVIVTVSSYVPSSLSVSLDSTGPSGPSILTWKSSPPDFFFFPSRSL